MAEFVMTLLGCAAILLIAVFIADFVDGDF